jgi:ribose 5-phosphate isomerase A
MLMTQDDLKKLVAKEAVKEILQTLPKGSLIGMGTGSTVNFLIEELKPYAGHFSGVVSSSDATTKRLLESGFHVYDANDVDRLPIYIDGADEIDPKGNMIKGGGGALTREKIVASLADQFICICDASKLVEVLGNFPLPTEVIPMASGQITRELSSLGAEVTIRKAKENPLQNFVTDNGGWILDARKLLIDDPLTLENRLNQLPGVICNGIFAIHSADLLLVSKEDKVERILF